MAVQDIKRGIEGLYKSIAIGKFGRSGTAREAQDRRFAFEITINHTTFADKMSQAENILLDVENNPDMETTVNDFLPIVKGFTQIF